VVRAHRRLTLCLVLVVANQIFVITDGVVAFAAVLMTAAVMVVLAALHAIKAVAVLAVIPETVVMVLLVA
jgi:hypothetical protein